jgi:hypothetical protein
MNCRGGIVFMKVQRYLTAYHNIGDREDLSAEWPISATVRDLVAIITHNRGDAEIYDVYGPLSEVQMNSIFRFVRKRPVIDRSKYEYFLECFRA